MKWQRIHETDVGIISVNKYIVLSITICALLVASCTQHKVVKQRNQPVVQQRVHDENYWPEIRKANESYRPPEGYTGSK